MHPFSFALKNVVRRPLRSALTILGVTIAVAGFLSLVGMTRALETAWLRSLAERDSHILAVRKGAVEILTASMDEALAAEISRIAGVHAATGELVDLVMIEDRVTLASGWPKGSYLWKTLRLAEGRAPAGESDVVIGSGLADLLGRRTGERVRIQHRDYRISGIAVPSSVMNQNSVIFGLASLQKVLGRNGKVTVFHVQVDELDDPREIENVRLRLHRAFGDLSFVVTSKAAEQNLIFRLFRAMAWGVSAIAVAMAAVVVLNTLLMTIAERKRELGILSALGWHPRRIMGTILLEGLLLTGAGAIAGGLSSAIVLDTLAGARPMRGFLEPTTDFATIAQAAIAALAVGSIGCAYPTWQAGRIDPYDALRYE